MPALRDVIAALDTWYPPALAEEWDAVGLVTGRRDDTVLRVALAVDPIPEVVDWAVAEGAQLLFAHHPLYLRGTTNVDGDSAKGAVIHRAITAGLAIHVAHTNADRARPGVSDALAEALGLVETRPIVPSATDHSLGIGRVGTLAQETTLAAFADTVAAALPHTAAGIRVAGDPSRPVERVALCGGAGGDLLDVVDADVYVTSDLRHHSAQEYLLTGRAALIDIAHAAAESLWLPGAAARLETLGVSTVVCPFITDPWTSHRA